MKNKKYAGYTQEDWELLLKRKEKEIKELKTKVKNTQDMYAAQSGLLRKMQSQANEGFLNSSDRQELLDQAIFYKHLYEFEQAARELSDRKKYEAQIKYDQLLAYLDDPEGYEWRFDHDTAWSRYESEIARLKAEKDAAEHTTALLQNEVLRYQKELAEIKADMEKHQKNVVVPKKKGFDIQVRNQIRAMRKTRKVDGSYPTIREIAQEFHVSIGTVHNYLKENDE